MAFTGFFLIAYLIVHATINAFIFFNDKDQGGWIVFLNMPEQTRYDFIKARIINYVELVNFLPWRTLKPEVLFNQIDNIFITRLDS